VTAPGPMPRRVRLICTVPGHHHQPTPISYEQTYDTSTQQHTCSRCGWSYPAGSVHTCGISNTTRLSPPVPAAGSIPADRPTMQEFKPWLELCGNCDAGLPMNCTCPTGDYRSVILELCNRLDASPSLPADTGGYVRSYYGVPAYIGTRVSFEGHPATITGFTGAYLILKRDDADAVDYDEEPLTYHPKWHITYLDAPPSLPADLRAAIERLCDAAHAASADFTGWPDAETLAKKRLSTTEAEVRRLMGMPK